MGEFSLVMIAITLLVSLLSYATEGHSATIEGRGVLEFRVSDDGMPDTGNRGQRGQR